MCIALVAASFQAVGSDNGEFIFYIAVLVGLMALIGAVYLRVRFPQAILWCLAAWGLLHLGGGLVAVPESWPIAGDMRVLYSWWIIPGLLKYDQAVHFFGFGVTTWLCWECLRTAIERPRPTAGLLLLAGAGGMGFGAFNEVVEFVATLLMPQTNVGGYENTGWDLVSNLAGCLVAAIAIRVFDRRT